MGQFKLIPNVDALGHVFSDILWKGYERFWVRPFLSHNSLYIESMEIIGKYNIYYGIDSMNTSSRWTRTCPQWSMAGFIEGFRSSNTKPPHSANPTNTIYYFCPIIAVTFSMWKLYGTVSMNMSSRCTCTYPKWCSIAWFISWPYHH